MEGIENYCDISFNNSHQHSDSTDARIEKGGYRMVEFFKHSPFPDTDAIMSIATGIIPDKSINCYDTFEVIKNR